MEAGGNYAVGMIGYNQFYFCGSWEWRYLEGLYNYRMALGPFAHSFALWFLPGREHLTDTHENGACDNYVIQENNKVIHKYRPGIKWVNARKLNGAG